MEKFVIEGGVPLSGTIVPAGNKNGALPILAACLLTDDEVILRNVPRITDVEAMVGLLETLGARVDGSAPGEVSVDCLDVDSTEVDRELAERIRASFLLAGPLLARFGRAAMPPPGGDVIGRRRLDPHLDAFRALGAPVEHGRATSMLDAPRRSGCTPCDFLMDEPSVMATENALMAAALTRGHDRDPQRRLRAARPGPGADAGRDGRADRRDRLQRDDRPRPAELRGCTHDDRPRPHRDRLVHGARRRDRRRAGRQGHGSRGPADDPAGVRAAGAAQRGPRRRRDRARQPAS